MAERVTSVHTDALPALRFIGRQCRCHPQEFTARWSEWFENGWFFQLEKIGIAPENGGAYLGLTIGDTYWIGLLFPPGTPVPDGFEYADHPAATYAVFGMDGRASGELFGEEGIRLVQEEMGRRGMREGVDAWGIEKYRCLKRADSGKQTNLLYEFWIAIEKAHYGKFRLDGKGFRYR